MKLIFASNGIVQTGGFVCGSVTLYAAHLANLIPIDKWTSLEVSTAVRKGSEGESLGSVFDEDYVEAAKDFNLDITNQCIADGMMNMNEPINPIYIKDNQMMALTCAGQNSVGHHMFITKYCKKWYWLESLACDLLTGQRSHNGTGTSCLRIYENSHEFEQDFVKTIKGYNWSLRGIKRAKTLFLFPTQQYTWNAYDASDMTLVSDNPLSVQKRGHVLALVSNLALPKLSIIPIFDLEPKKSTDPGLCLMRFVQHSPEANAIIREFPDLKITSKLWSGLVLQTIRPISKGECITY